jgi:carboxyl-terminal processing protease
MSENNTHYVYPAADPVTQPPYQPPVQPEPKGRTTIWKFVVIILVTALVTFTLTAGAGLLVYYGIEATRETEGGSDLGIPFADDEATQQALKKFWAAYQQVDENYYRDLSDAEMLEAMTRGLVDEMDSPYTMYLTAEQVQQINDSMSGNYTGIGCFVSMNKEGLVEIIEVIAGSPAEAAGIRVGDEFIEVDGQDVTAFEEIDSVAALVRGDEGTTVDLVFYRPSEQKNITVTATRRKITTASVSAKMVSATIGYVVVRDFSTNVSANFIAAVDSLQQQGATDIIFDLRNNTGGLASEVVAMLDYLLPEVTVATLKGRSDGKETSESWTSGKSMGVPDDMQYAILMNSYTASASELFAGCLRDLGKAYLIGEQSFGKGSGTITIGLEDGSAINLTTFKYYLPSGISIEGEGLKPDKEVVLPDETAGLSISQLTPEQDTQMQAALGYLESLPTGN